MPDLLIALQSIQWPDSQTINEWLWHGGNIVAGLMVANILISVTYQFIRDKRRGLV